MTIVERFKLMSKASIASSVLLFLAAIAAAVVANSPLSDIYQGFLSQELHLRIGSFNLFSHHGEPLKVIEFINDGLMTVFFFMVGLEIKREILVGELSSIRKSLLPLIAACGGMIAPVLVYYAFCPPGTEGSNGFAIPMATDIAFSLGVLSLLGNRVPVSLKIFLTALAVADDIGGILMIAIFYSKHIELMYLGIAAVLYVIMYYVSKNSEISNLFLFLMGLTIWYLFMQSGIHSTISGVLLAFTIRAHPRLNVGKYVDRIRTHIGQLPMIEEDKIVFSKEELRLLEDIGYSSMRVISPIQKLEENLHSMVNFVILPLFAFVNAGVVLGGDGPLIGPVSLAVGCGLLLGKFFGIYSFTWLAIKTGITPQPDGMNFKNLAGVALLGGIGFTVSLFIADLSFGGKFPVLLNEAKFGVIAGSVCSGILGYIVLRLVTTNRKVAE